MSWQNDADNLKKKSPTHILFLCVANSARSQMAEGLARSLAPTSVKISSAGSNPSKVNPLAIQALLEINIDIRDHYSKSIEAIDNNSVDTVITLCADEICPAFFGNVHRIHWGLPDPTNDIESFRKIRDELSRRLNYLFQ